MLQARKLRPNHQTRIFLNAKPCRQTSARASQNPCLASQAGDQSLADWHSPASACHIYQQADQENGFKDEV